MQFVVWSHVKDFFKNLHKVLKVLQSTVLLYLESIYQLKEQIEILENTLLIGFLAESDVKIDTSLMQNMKLQPAAGELILLPAKK